MQHKVKVTVIDKKVYPQLQAQYCANPESGACSCYNVGDEFIFERYGSDFRRQVWDILCRIPYGQVTTYKEISKKIADANGLDHMSAQAVGGAVGHNPISVIIPCHRVVGTDGSLTGYAGGIDRKIKLLTLEGVDMGRQFVPGEKAAAIYRVS